MSAHRYHPDPKRGDAEDAVLFADCERCEEHALAPWDALDRFRIAELMTPDREPRNSLERVCIRVIRETLERAQYLMRSANLGKVGDLR